MTKGGFPETKKLLTVSASFRNSWELLNHQLGCYYKHASNGAVSFWITYPARPEEREDFVLRIVSLLLYATWEMLAQLPVTAEPSTRSKVIISFVTSSPLSSSKASRIAPSLTRCVTNTSSASSPFRSVWLTRSKLTPY